MRLLNEFLDPASVSLKICGITREEDAQRLVEMQVCALGINFWPHSKRYLAPEHATWLKTFAGKILRVGVFVNAPPEIPMQLLKSNCIDLIQLHGDETAQDAQVYHDAGMPIIKAIGVKSIDSLSHASDFQARAILLDAHAPGVYGGTGATFDWHTANEFKANHPCLPIILAGGITPENAASAAHLVAPAALDIASGAESAPGVKDFNKVAALLHALSSTQP